MRTQKQTTFNPPSVIRAGDHFDRKQTEKQLYHALQQKNQQLIILHNINSRLAQQLAQLQLKLGIDPYQIVKQLQQIGQISPIFHADLGQLKYLKELFVAYDGTVAKQKKIIAMLYSQLSDAQKKSQSIVRQNQYLMQQNKNKCKKILQIYHRGYPEQNLTNSYSKLLKQMQTQKNLLIREQSQHINDIYRQLEQHTHDVETQLEQSKIAAEKYFKMFKKQSEELKQSMLSVDNLLKVKQFLEKTVSKIGEQNIALQTAKNELENKVGKLEIQIKSLRNQLFSQKKINRQDNQRISIQLDTLKAQTDSAIKRQRQTFNRNLILQKDFQNIKQTTRSLKKQNEKVKGELQQTIKMCQAYQSKITSLTRKQQGIVDMLDKNKEKLDSILLQKDKSMLKVEQLEKIIENMNARHRDQMVKLRQNYEKMNADQQEKLLMYEQERQEIQTANLQTQLNLKNQIEKLKRQNSLLHNQNMKFIQSIHLNTGSQITNKLKQYQQKNDSLYKLLNQKDRHLKDQQSKYQQIIHDYENEIRNLNRLLQKQRSMTTQYMKEITQERSKLSILNNEIQCLENQVKKLKRNNENKHNKQYDDKQFKINQLQIKLGQAVKKQKQIRQKAIDMLQHYDQEEVKLKNQYDKKIIQLQGENEKLRRKVQKMKRKLNE